jgi:hypothetical protein
MFSRTKAPRAALVGLALVAMACTGEVGQGAGAPGPGPTAPGESPGSRTPPGGSGGSTTPAPGQGPAVGADSAGPHALRRLTLLEYQNTIRDLLGVTLTDTDRRGFAADQVGQGGYGNGAAIVTSVDSRQFLDTSGKLAAAAVADPGKLLPPGCAAPAPDAEAGCIGTFIETFGLRAFRRPLDPGERDRLLALYQQLRGPEVGASYVEAVHDLVLAFLQAPEFLYRWELDGPPIQDGELVRFGPYEIASRLSYFLWATMPDDQLFAAARSGGLQRPEQIAAQAERMLKDERARAGLRDFHLQWLGIYGVDELEKDESFTTYSPEVARAMLAESAAFLDANLFDPQASGKLETLLTSSSSFVNGPLARHYGAAGVTGEGFAKVELNPMQRAGILTHGAYLARHAKEAESFPIARGVHVLRQILCQDIPEPNVELPPAPEQMAGVTTRKLYEDFTSAGACQVCHGRINGVGFAFENYDAVGAYRDREEGQPIDASGTLELPSGKISFRNGIELVKQLASTPEVRDCAARNWMRFLLRRDERPEEAGSLRAAQEAFSASSHDVRSLLIGLTRTRAFTHRNPLAK